MLRAILCTLTLALAAPASAQTLYKCKTASGGTVYQDRACDTGSAQVDSREIDKPKRRASGYSPEEIKRRAAWRTLCGNTSIDYSTSCVTDHAIAFDEMTRTIARNPGDDVLRRADKCFKRYYRPAVGAVDAKMWRYCYFNSRD